MRALDDWRTRAALAAIGLLGVVGCGPPGVDETPSNAPSVTVKSVVTTRATTTTAPPIFTPADSVAHTDPAVTRPSTPGSPQTSAPATGGTTGAATAICNDGSYWYAAQHQGACAEHGGVAVFYR